MARRGAWHRIFADEESRWLLWSAAGAVVYASLVWSGRSSAEAVFRALCLAAGGHLVDYGIVAGVIKRDIRRHNHGSVRTAARYHGRAAFWWGAMQAVAGTIALALGVLVRFSGPQR